MPYMKSCCEYVEKKEVLITRLLAHELIVQVTYNKTDQQKDAWSVFHYVMTQKL
jgi:hypothetical protein